MLTPSLLFKIKEKLTNCISNLCRKRLKSYVLLESLNNLPRTRYLARVRNPHPALIDKDDRDSVRGGRETVRDQGGEPAAAAIKPTDESH